VDELCDELFKKRKKIVHQEDFSVMAYDVLIHDDSNKEPIEYRCTLDRDNDSDVKVVKKKAEANTRTTISKLYKKVSCK
jgi:hypothetical protein